MAILSFSKKELDCLLEALNYAGRYDVDMKNKEALLDCIYKLHGKIHEMEMDASALKLLRELRAKEDVA